MKTFQQKTQHIATHLLCTGLSPGELCESALLAVHWCVWGSAPRFCAQDIPAKCRLSVGPLAPPVLVLSEVAVCMLPMLDLCQGEAATAPSGLYPVCSIC